EGALLGAAEVELDDVVLGVLAVEAGSDRLQPGGTLVPTTVRRGRLQPRAVAVDVDQPVLGIHAEVLEEAVATPGARLVVGQDRDRPRAVVTRARGHEGAGLVT